MLIPSSDYIFHRSYHFFDDMCEEIRQWNLDFQQIERGLFSADILQFGTGSVHITEAKFGRSLHQRGNPPEGFRTIGIPASSKVHINWRGQQCDGRTDLLVFPKGAELESISDEHFHVFTCSFPEELLSELSDQLDLDELDKLQKGHEVIRCQEKTLARLQHSVSTLSDSLRSTPDAIRSPLISEFLSAAFPRQILSTIAESRGVDLPVVNSNRQMAISKALSFLERSAHEAISMQKLSEVAGVSQRTLEYAFREHFGVTPKTYQLTHRLHKVRREIRGSEKRAARISDLANRWGFWHMGQFAADYESVFGELPSDTRVLNSKR